mmetsp:Transcript_55088/g.118208  ORF Transcript_55088/g.118208 Transcript_55088/m.118208 type:complete len:203 (-) Transcript_55088:710-1318(-)
MDGSGNCIRRDCCLRVSLRDLDLGSIGGRKRSGLYPRRLPCPAAHQGGEARPHLACVPAALDHAFGHLARSLQLLVRRGYFGNRLVLHVRFPHDVGGPPCWVRRWRVALEHCCALRLCATYCDYADVGAVMWRGMGAEGGSSHVGPQDHPFRRCVRHLPHHFRPVLSLDACGQSLHRAHVHHRSCERRGRGKGKPLLAASVP